MQRLRGSAPRFNPTSSEKGDSGRSHEQRGGGQVLTSTDETTAAAAVPTQWGWPEEIM